MYQIVIQNFCAYFWRVYLWEFSSARIILAGVVSDFLFSRSSTASSIVAMIFLLDSALEVLENLRPFAAGSVSN